MKKLVIIGGGIAGLSAGIFGQKNGFETVILEKHHTLGGQCTGWNRQGYHIDGCIHWLLGTKKHTSLWELWNTVGALDQVEIYHPESFMAVEHQGRTVNFYRDIERLRTSWIEISPEDKSTIEEFCNDIKRIQDFNIPTGKPMDMMNIFEKIKALTSMKDAAMIMKKYGKINFHEFSNRFKHPALKMAIYSFMPEGDYSVSSIIFALGTFTGGQSSIPLGGSKKLAQRMVEKYISLGGTVEASCEVEELIIKGDHVEKLICKNKKIFEGDFFIAACDAHTLYENLLKGKYPDTEYQKRFDNPDIYPLASNIYVGIGYEGIMDDTPRSLKFPVNNIEIRQNNRPIDHLQMTHYSYEEDFAPEGHTVITFAINQYEEDLSKWEKLVENQEEYIKEKNRIGKELIRAMEDRFPHMKGKLKLLDVASPQTYKNYCNAYRGAFMGFWPTIKGKNLQHSGEIKGLKNILLSGQWLEPPGGLPTAVITGKQTIMRLCHKEKKSFIGN